MESSLIVALICFAAYPLVISQTVVYLRCDWEPSEMCGFTSSSSNYKVGENSVEPQSNWRQGTGRTPTASNGDSTPITGPEGAQSGSYYIYFEASSLDDGINSGILRSPDMDGKRTRVTDLSFYVSNKGMSLDRLDLRFMDASTNVNFLTVNVRNPAQAIYSNVNWEFFSYNLNSNQFYNRNFYMEFFASVKSVNGISYNGDWAIDNLQVNAVKPCAGDTCTSIANSVCQNTPDGPQCLCVGGYQQKTGTSGVNTVCVETCGNSPCNPNTNCITIPDIGVDCQCRVGYQALSGTSGRNTQCQAVDLCLTNPCVNGRKNCVTLSGGSYRCECFANQNYYAPEDKCYRNGGLSEWRNQGTCSKTCDEGIQTQVRVCDNPPRELPYGLDCPSNEVKVKGVPCNLGSCLGGCTRNKTCTCENVRKYITGEEPKPDLSSFTLLSSMDGKMARSHVQTYSKEYIAKTISDAKCDKNKILMVHGAMQPIIADMKIKESNYMTEKMEMQDIIDCNNNIAIENNLWDVYDMLADHCICISQMHKDLVMKSDMLEAEIARCDSRGWYSSLLDTIVM